MPNGRSRGRRRGRRPKRRSNEKGGRTVQTAAPALFAFMGSLSSSVGLSAWRWACAVPRCGSRCFRNGQRKAIIRTHRLSETGSDYIGLVRLKGLEPTRIAAREPKGDVTLVKHFFSALLFFTLFHLLLKCLFQHFPPRLLGQGILIQLAHFYRLANLNIGFAKGERDHTRCTGRDSSANY